jgi:hypothetical protein
MWPAASSDDSAEDPCSAEINQDSTQRLVELARLPVIGRFECRADRRAGRRATLLSKARTLSRLGVSTVGGLARVRPDRSRATGCHNEPGGWFRTPVPIVTRYVCHPDRHRADASLRSGEWVGASPTGAFGSNPTGESCGHPGLSGPPAITGEEQFRIPRMTR